MVELLKVQETGMTPQQVFDYYGGKSQTAHTLGISYEAVRKWELSGVVPDGRQYELQIKTNGALKANPRAA